MPRRRLGAVVLLDPPVSDEVNGLRRAVGDRALERIAPHITLVPPVNVAADRLVDVLILLRRAAARSAPFEVELGPVGSFLPANRVVLLRVGGDLPALSALRDDIFAPPLDRPLAWPWVPHVTLGDDLGDERISAAMAVLDGYRSTVTVDRVVLLEEVRTDDGRRWRPLADAALGPRRIVGRGGLELDLTAGRLIDPEAQAVLDACGGQPSDAAAAEPPAPVPTHVVTGRRAGTVAGVAVAWMEPDGTHVAVAVRPDDRRQGVGAHLLAALATDLDGVGRDGRDLLSHGPAGFYGRFGDRFRPAGYSKAMDE